MRDRQAYFAEHKAPSKTLQHSNEHPALILKLGISSKRKQATETNSEELKELAAKKLRNFIDRSLNAYKIQFDNKEEEANKQDYRKRLQA